MVNLLLVDGGLLNFIDAAGNLVNNKDLLGDIRKY
jgi:hypothetical protein